MGFKQFLGKLAKNKANKGAGASNKLSGLAKKQAGSSKIQNNMGKVQGGGGGGQKQFFDKWVNQKLNKQLGGYGGKKSEGLGGSSNLIRDKKGAAEKQEEASETQERTEKEQEKAYEEQEKTAEAQREAAEAEKKAYEGGSGGGEGGGGGSGSPTALHEEDSEAGERAGSVSSTSFTLGILLCILYDFADGFLTTFGISEIVELPINFIFQLYLKKTMGNYFHKMTWLEMIPFVDILPIYTISAAVAFKKYRNDHATDEDKKSKISQGRQKRQNFNINLKNAAGSKMGKRIILVLILLLIIMGGVFMTSQKGATFVGEQLGNVRYFVLEGGWKDVFKGMTESMQTGVKRVTQMVSEQMYYAKTGKEYSGQVDKNVEKDLGMKLKYREGVKDTFYLDRGSVYLPSVLSGRNINPDVCNLIGEECSLEPIELECYDDEGYEGKIDPKEVTFDQIRDTSYGVRCEFGDVFEEEDRSREITTEARFNFITSAYYTADFVSESKYRELQRQGKEIEKKEAEFTPGPVEVGFVKFSIYPLVVGEKRRANFGIEIKNKGNGRIEEFDKVVFEIPEGVKKDTCTIPVEEEGNNRYSIPGDTLNRYNNLDKYDTLRLDCSLDLSSSEVLDANTPITTDDFNLLAKYDYTLEKTKDVELKHFMPQIASGKTCDSEGGCWCPEGDKVNKDERCPGEETAVS